VRSLRSVLDHLPGGVELVYVDGGSPDDVARELESMVRDAGGTWIRRDCVLTGNEARNLARVHATREYVLFIDNDVFPHDGFAEHLVRCAEETGAAMVAPVILHGSKESSREIHIAGGRTEIVDGVLAVNKHLHEFEQLDDVRSQLQRRPTGQLEFHCFLMRRSVLETLGGFDEALQSMADHEDVVFGVQRLGLEIWIEPAAVVLYLNRVPLDDREVPFWLWRYSERANNASIDHFTAKWQLAPDRGWPEVARMWSAAERTRWMHGRGPGYEQVGKALRKAFWTGPVSPLARRVETTIYGRRTAGEVARRRAVLGHP
jgi:GT2 family glycosyltransferase